MAQAEAEALAALGLEEKGAVVVTAAEGWHPGVVGLVAARLKERYGRPAFAIALEPGGIGTGSGRSIAGVDLGRAVRQAVADGLLLKGGGHAMAAGVTLAKGGLAAFRAFLEADAWSVGGDCAARQRLGDRWRGQCRRRQSGAVRVAGARRSLWRRQSGAGAGAAGAYAGLRRSGRREPCARAFPFRRRQVRQCDCVPVAGTPLGRALIDNRGRQMHAAGTLSVDRWQGEERVQMRLTDVALS